MMRKQISNDIEVTYSWNFSRYDRKLTENELPYGELLAIIFQEGVLNYPQCAPSL